jgi:hypothetical protein
MVAVGGVAVPVVLVVDVVLVSDGRMPAAWPVSVRMAGMGQMGQRVLVVVVVMRGMGVTFVNIVRVPLTLDAGMPAAGSVVMRVTGVDLVFGGHGSSLL